MTGSGGKERFLIPNHIKKAGISRIKFRGNEDAIMGVGRNFFRYQRGMYQALVGSWSGVDREL